MMACKQQKGWLGDCVSKLSARGDVNEELGVQIGVHLEQGQPASATNLLGWALQLHSKPCNQAKSVTTSTEMAAGSRRLATLHTCYQWFQPLEEILRNGSASCTTIELKGRICDGHRVDFPGCSQKGQWPRCLQR